MANDETQIYRAELDISDFNTKADQLEAKIAQIRKGRANNEDTSALEKDLAKEFDGLANVIRQQEKAGASTEDLLKQRERLGAVVRSLGGSFSGLIGDLGGVIELLMSGSGAAVAFGGALAAVGAVSAVINRVKTEMAELRKEQEAIAKNAREMKAEFLGPQEQMAAVLQRFGGLTPETEAASGEMRRRLERNAGFDRGQATAVSPLAVLSGMSVEDTELAAQLLVSGVQFDSPDEMQKAVARLKSQPEALAGVQRQIQTLPLTEKGKRVRAAAAAQPYGAVRQTETELAFETARGAGAIGTDVSFEQFKERLDEAERLIQAIGGLIRTKAAAVRRRDVYPDEAIGWGPTGEDLLTRDDLQDRLNEIHGHDLDRAARRARMIDREGGSGTASPVLANPPAIFHIGTVIAAPGTDYFRPTQPYGNQPVNTGTDSSALTGGGAP